MHQHWVGVAVLKAVLSHRAGMEFNTLVFPGPRHSYYDIMSDEAASIHGITAQRLREPDVPSAEAVSLALGLWLLQRCLATSGGRGAVPLLLAHNARFDMCMLGSLLSLSRLQSGPSWHQLCSCTLAKAKVRGCGALAAARANVTAEPPLLTSRGLVCTWLALGSRVLIAHTVTPACCTLHAVPAACVAPVGGPGPQHPGVHRPAAAPCST